MYETITMLKLTEIDLLVKSVNCDFRLCQCNYMIVCVWQGKTANSASVQKEVNIVFIVLPTIYDGSVRSPGRDIEPFS